MTVNAANQQRLAVQQQQTIFNPHLAETDVAGFCFNQRAVGGARSHRTIEIRDFGAPQFGFSTFRRSVTRSAPPRSSIISPPKAHGALQRPCVLLPCHRNRRPAKVSSRAAHMRTSELLPPVPSAAEIIIKLVVTWKSFDLRGRFMRQPRRLENAFHRHISTIFQITARHSSAAPSPLRRFSGA